MLTTRKPNSLSLYIHIPFCATRCNYCSFNTYANLQHLLPAYLDALKAELRLWGEALRKPPVKTVYFGGGTPSLLIGMQIEAVLKACFDSFLVETGAEVTAEANPDDIRGSKPADLHSAGINRLSIGVQSLIDRHLAALTRRHTVQDAVDAYECARKAGFDNINLDFIYGLPRQSLEEWRETLKQAISLAPEHLSLYALTVEEDTSLHKDIHLTRSVPEPDPDLAADMYELAEEVLGAAGYRHYEISNWAKPGYEALHNLTYWRNQPYLGVGAGAHSYLGDYRFHDVLSSPKYIHEVNKRAAGVHIISCCVTSPLIQSIAPAEDIEHIDQSLEMKETMMMGLRLEEGVSLAGFARRFGVELTQVYGAILPDLEQGGLLREEGGSLKLTSRGRLLSNEVFVRFLSG